MAVLTDRSRPSPFLAELTGTAPRGIKRPAAKATAAPAPRPVEALGPEGERADQALRAWRLERSRRDKVPAFIVLNDRHLRAVAAAAPTTLRELRAVDGIGPTKLELYGEEILAVLESLRQLAGTWVPSGTAAPTRRRRRRPTPA